MPIEIYCVENLNWDNGSYKVPNAIPTVFKDKKTVKGIPSINNYYGGSIPLTGDHWNWCKYDGVYYFLKRERPLDTKNKDPKKHRWLYFLVRDHWTNTVLLNKVIIKGDIATWNIESDIEENLNRTSLIIENPIGLARVCFEKTKITWKNSLYPIISRRPIKESFKEIYLTKNTINFLVEKAKVVKEYQTVKPYIYKQRKDLFLFANIRPTYANSPWKEEVAKRVNQALNDIIEDETAFLGKVEFTSGGFNALTGHYCITYDKQAIGNRDETVQVNEIDLSKVKDIKRVSWQDLKSTRAESPLTLDTALLDIDIQGRQYHEENRVFKLSQRNFLPLGQDVLQGRWQPTAYLSSNWYEQNPGQRIVLNKDGNKDLKLYYVDQISFFLSWYVGTDYHFNSRYQSETTRTYGHGAAYWQAKTAVSFAIPGFDWLAKQISGVEFSQAQADLFFLDKDLTVYGYTANRSSPSWIAHKQTISSNNSYELLRQTIASLTYNNTYLITKTESVRDRKPEQTELWTPAVLPHVTFNVEGGNKDKFIWNKFVQSPSYGFLIWQITRPRAEWRLFEYLGDKAKDKVDVITGINQYEFNKVYGDTNGDGKEWWRRVNKHHPLSKFTGQEEFAKLYLDLWQLNFLHFFPIPNDSKTYETQQYKCDYGDGWYSIGQFLKQRQDCETVKVLGEQNLKDLDGNELENPWTPELFIKYSKIIEQKLDNVVIKEELELPQPLEKGDYLISSLEYRWDDYDNRHWTSNPTLVNWIKGDSWEAHTLNLLEDFVRINPSSRTRRDISLEEAVDWKDKDSAQIFLGADIDGDISFFTCWRFEKTHRLSNSPDQYIQEVDGQDNKRIKYYLLKKQKTRIEDIGTQASLLDLIAGFYEVVAKQKIERKEDQNLILWDRLRPSDLEKPEGNLFDLIGSDWFVFIREDKVHFIYKKEKGPAISSILENVESFKYPKDPSENSNFSSSEGIKALKDLPLIAKVNQVNTLYYKSYPISIKTKFLFDQKKKDSIPIAAIEGVETEANLTTMDNYMFKFQADHDYIEQIIRIPKEPVKGRAIADQVSIDKLRIESQKIAEDADLERRQLGLNQQIFESSIRRQEFDLSVEETYKHLSDAFAVGTNVVSLASGPARALPLIGQGLATTASQYGNRIVSGGIQQSLNLARTDRYGIPKLPPLTAGGLLGNQSTVNNSFWYNSVLPEKARRIEEDKQFKFQQYAIDSYRIDQRHREKKVQNALTINRLAHEWIKEPINDAYVHKKWMTKKKVSEFYMLVRYPTGIQLDQLQQHVNDYGIDIDLPDRVVTLRAGMTPNIIRMANVHIDEIKGVNNILDREYLARRLEAGIKIYSIEDTELPEFDYFETSLYLPKYKNYDNLEKEVKELRIQIEELQNTHTGESRESTQLRRFLITKLEDPIDDIDKLTKDLKDLEDKANEIKGNKDKYGEEAEKLVNEVFEVLNKRLEKAKEIEAKQKELTKQKDEAVKAKDEAENERDNLREDLNKAHNKARSLLNEQEALHRNLANTRHDLEEAKQELHKVEGELEQEQELARKQTEELTNLRQENKKLKESCDPSIKDDLDKANEKIKELEQEIKDIEPWQWHVYDFLKYMHSINYDYHTFYKKIKDLKDLGLTSYEIYNSKYTFLIQAIIQTIEDCEDLLDNNTSFLASGNEELRNRLLNRRSREAIYLIKLKKILLTIYTAIFTTRSHETLKTPGSINADFSKKGIPVFYHILGGSNTFKRKWKMPPVQQGFYLIGNQADSAWPDVLRFSNSWYDLFRWRKERWQDSDNWNNTLYYNHGFYDFKSPLAIALFGIMYKFDVWQDYDYLGNFSIKRPLLKQTLREWYEKKPKNGYTPNWGTYRITNTSRITRAGYLIYLINWLSYEWPSDTAKQERSINAGAPADPDSFTFWIVRLVERYFAENIFANNIKNKIAFLYKRNIEKKDKDTAEQEALSEIKLEDGNRW